MSEDKKKVERKNGSRRIVKGTVFSIDVGKKAKRQDGGGSYKATILEVEVPEYEDNIVRKYPQKSLEQSFNAKTKSALESLNEDDEITMVCTWKDGYWNTKSISEGFDGEAGVSFPDENGGNSGSGGGGANPDELAAAACLQGACSLLTSKASSEDVTEKALELYGAYEDILADISGTEEDDEEDSDEDDDDDDFEEEEEPPKKKRAAKKKQPVVEDDEDDDDEFDDD